MEILDDPVATADASQHSTFESARRRIWQQEPLLIRDMRVMLQSREVRRVEDGAQHSVALCVKLARGLHDGFFPHCAAGATRIPM